MGSFVTRLPSTEDTTEGLKVATTAGGSHYVYELRKLDGDDDPDDTLEVVSKTVDGEPADPEATQHVEDVAADYGFDVQ